MDHVNFLNLLISCKFSLWESTHGLDFHSPTFVFIFDCETAGVGGGVSMIYSFPVLTFDL